MTTATPTEDSVAVEEAATVERKFDSVLIEYATHNAEKDFTNWEAMDIEEQRELLARGVVRFFLGSDEIPFHRALL